MISDNYFQNSFWMYLAIFLSQTHFTASEGNVMFHILKRTIYNKE